MEAAPVVTSPGERMAVRRCEGFSCGLAVVDPEMIPRPRGLQLPLQFCSQVDRSPGTATSIRYRENASPDLGMAVQRQGFALPVAIAIPDLAHVALVHHLFSSFVSPLQYGGEPRRHAWNVVLQRRRRCQAPLRVQDDEDEDRDAG